MKTIKYESALFSKTFLAFSTWNFSERLLHSKKVIFVQAFAYLMQIFHFKLTYNHFTAHVRITIIKKTVNILEIAISQGNQDINANINSEFSPDSRRIVSSSPFPEKLGRNFRFSGKREGFPLNNLKFHYFTTHSKNSLRSVLSWGLVPRRTSSKVSYRMLEQHLIVLIFDKFSLRGKHLE